MGWAAPSGRLAGFKASHQPIRVILTDGFAGESRAMFGVEIPVTKSAKVEQLKPQEKKQFTFPQRKTMRTNDSYS